jgi:gag-polypeptide of LTR copia-type
LLEKRFNPKGLSKSVNLTNELAAIKMKPSDNPNDLIDKLEEIQVRYTELGCMVDEETLVARVVVVSPKSYKSSLVQLQLQALGENKKGTLEKVRETMDLYYDQAFGEAAKQSGADADEEDKKEVALSNADKPGRARAKAKAVVSRAAVTIAASTGTGRKSAPRRREMDRISPRVLVPVLLLLHKADRSARTAKGAGTQRTSAG